MPAWKRYRYDGTEDVLVLDTAEGARVLSTGDTVVLSELAELTGRPFTPVGGKVPDPAPEPDAAPAPELSPAPPADEISAPAQEESK